MKILITGGSGLLGKALLETKPQIADVALTWNKNIYGVANTLDLWYKLDIRDRSQVFEVFEIFKPNLVIHCAAIGGVDYSETHYDETREVNVSGLAHVIDACNGYKCKLVYVSTNAVYSGRNPPYNERSALEPVNAYGVIKREAEQKVRDKADKWLIVRPFMLYGWTYPGARTNWVIYIVQSLRNKNPKKLVDDVIWMPTYAPNCADVIWQLALKEINNEIFNVASPERVTLYQFGLQVCDVFDLDKNLLEPVNSDFFASIAERPKDTTYDLVKLAEYGFMLDDVRTGLMRMKKAKK